MRITAIQTKNFLGARNVDLKLTKPVCIVSGPNGSGKSSLQEAVRQAITGESVRVSLKKDYRKLVTDGSEVGYAVVEHDGGRSAITLPNGAQEHTGNGRPPAAVSFCLDAQRFARLDATERRQFLFGLMGLQTDGPAVTDRLRAKGCDAAKVEAVAPLLRAGFDAAHHEAQAMAREAKATWRAITGETYGSVKAVTWAARKPEFDRRKLGAERRSLGSLNDQIERSAAAIAVKVSAMERQAQQSEKLSRLRETAKRYAAIEAKLRKDQAELAEWQATVERETAQPVETTYQCPKCAATLRLDHTNEDLIECAATPHAAYPIDHGKLAEYQKARDLLARSVENDKRDLATAELAAKNLAEIEDAQGAPETSQEEIEEDRKALSDLRKESTRLSALVKGLEEAERIASTADEKTASAARHHADVDGWESIANALSPGGIPGELLAEALGPINARLARSSRSAEWLRVSIAKDMTITTDGGRPYAMLSESEMWRADAMISEAIAHLSGVRVLTLDRFDVLDLKGRDDLLYWLDELAENGDLDTALITGTLKGLPARLPERIEAHWIESGAVVKILEDA